MLRHRSTVLAVLACTPLLLAACTSGSSPAPAPSTSTSTSTSTLTSTAATGVPTPTPLTGGPTTAARATTCPFATQTFVHDTVGMRLGRVTRLVSGGKVVGCRIYALQGGSLHATEHLPGPNQPAVEITTQRYASSDDAHNAFVLRAEAGTNPQQVGFGSVTGLCFQNRFDPQDKGTDYACTVNKGSTLVLVRTVDNTGYLNTKNLLIAVLRAV